MKQDSAFLLSSGGIVMRYSTESKVIEEVKEPSFVPNWKEFLDSEKNSN